MPSLSKRRERDFRAGRFESEIRVSELGQIPKNDKGLPTCMKCHTPFQEASRHCPRCDTKTMAYAREIPDEWKDYARRRALERARRRIG